MGEFPGQFPGQEIGPFFIGVLEQELYHAGYGRITGLTPLFQHPACDILPVQQAGKDRMVRLPGLNDKAAATSLEQGQHLEGPFVGPEVLAGENAVRRHQGNQSQFIVLESPGHHGVAQQDIKFSFSECPKCFRLVFRRTVHAGDAGRRAILQHFLFHLPAAGKNAPGPHQEHLLSGIQRLPDLLQQFQGETAGHASLAVFRPCVDKVQPRLDFRFAFL